MAEHTSLDELPEETHAEVFEAHRPRTVRLTLEQGEKIPAHTHPGMDIVLHLVSGHLELSLDDETVDVHPGELVQFSGERDISPRAVDDSTAVLVFAPAPTSE
ncbi:cupin domain-containing protein [Haloferax mediterranei ATCC 33500]|uniref:Cupin n=1 Tax=Haloferax mediterranei (strain ATCC 33500 / DSM 1411 / JCM 8866 / NBRC 14739 / NCIMB 2177 / R-4) TaxID=523841 RepID=I3R6L0_HALMT|nr:cupin domain-containing protein [Haloferax mediterranei]AFK19870.1 hypothetical protein HFX_2181 [Haloferax mediterranei ATCC 33500]AHZ23251.1 cupin [Haloferax mediterranei ATCC 33500]ELZ99837.1 hypothetical protein C439_12714 [Haloferax mediterranei ATCC 33500]MDX5987381.1 cupin domain-containing protein [Haloferax mediterranei ATCC 33500]QCQ73889.1 cupin domain-containing protein [Haloferax mediterranei ATCC 33500]